MNRRKGVAASVSSSGPGAYVLTLLRIPDIMQLADFIDENPLFEVASVSVGMQMCRITILCGLQSLEFICEIFHHLENSSFSFIRI